MGVFDDPLDHGCDSIAIVDSHRVEIADLLGDGAGVYDGILGNFIDRDSVDVGEGGS